MTGVVRNQIKESPEFKQLQQDKGEQNQSATVGDAIPALGDMDRDDAILWLQVLQLVVLVLILRELGGG